MSEAAIEVIDFRKEYAGTIAADGISFSLPRGVVGALIGPNGVRCVVFFVPPQERFASQALMLLKIRWKLSNASLTCPMILHCSKL
jgi:hypothetical protein